MLLDQADLRLRQKSIEVSLKEYGSEALKGLIDMMFDLMKNKEAVGLAAPQIGIHKRIIVFGTEHSKRTIAEGIPNTVLINPVFTPLSDEVEMGLEGCLNFGELREEVPRAARIEYAGYDFFGNYTKKQATGLEARIIQHEIDHLNGVLFIDYRED